MNFFLKRRKELSQKRGKTVSQFKLAVELGVTPSLISMWERGERIPSLKIIADVARAYELPVEKVEQEILRFSREAAKREAALSAAD